MITTLAEPLDKSDERCYERKTQSWTIPEGVYEIKENIFAFSLFVAVEREKTPFKTSMVIYGEKTWNTFFYTLPGFLSHIINRTDRILKSEGKDKITTKGKHFWNVIVLTAEWKVLDNLSFFVLHYMDHHGK